MGYNSGVLNVPQTVIVSALRLSTLQWSIAVAIFCIGGLVGSMLGGKTADAIGRKNFLIANNALFIGGGLLEALSSGFLMMSTGRLLIGMGCGGATVVVPMYLGEIAPANLRGSLGAMNQFFMVVGILVANLLGKPLGSNPSGFEWRYLLGLCLAPAMLQTLMSATLLESPLWLVQQGGSKNRVHAEEVLSRLRGTEDVEFDLECMVAEVEGADQEELDDYDMTDPFETGSSSASSRTAPDVLGDSRLEKGSLQHPPHQSAKAVREAHEARGSLWHSEYRRPLLIGFGLQLVQQFSGINAVFFYSTSFFLSAHMSDPWLGTVLASFVNVVATGLSIWLIERSGRRVLLMLSTGGMMLSCVGLTYALERATPAAMGGLPAPAWVGYMSIAMVLVFVAFFEIGLGPIPWLIGAEIYPHRVRTQAMAVSSTINWLSNFLVGLSFPTIALMLGPYSFVPFGLVLALALILEAIYVPETQGKTLEEIQAEFMKDFEAQDEAMEQEQQEEEEEQEQEEEAHEDAVDTIARNQHANASAILPHAGNGAIAALTGKHSARRSSRHSASASDTDEIPEGREDEHDAASHSNGHGHGNGSRRHYDDQ